MLSILIVHRAGGTFWRFLFVTVGTDTSNAASARLGLGGVEALLRARETEKRNHPVIGRILNEQGNNTVFTPIVLTASGGMGPSLV